MSQRQNVQTKMIARLYFAFFFAAITLLTVNLYAADDVKVNILAVNPSESNRLEAPITHYLPPEVKPEDILDRAGLDVKYDQDRQVYFLSGKVTLEPKETKTLNVRVKNVWALPDDLIAEARENINQNLKSLEGTEYYDTAKLLFDRVSEQITSMEEAKGKAIGIKQKIELYRAQMKQLDMIQKDVLSMNSLRTLKADPSQITRTAKFIITAENPSSEARKMTVRAELPKDIGANDVIDKLDFLLLFDDGAKRYILEKEDTLQGNEKKKYQITIKDIWYIPKDRLDDLRIQTKTLIGHFKGSSYDAYSKQQGEFIFSHLDQINALQDEVLNSPAIEDRIRAYVLNQSRFELAKRKVKDLQDLLLEIPIKRQETAIDQIRKAVKSLTHVIDLIKLGFKPDLSTTWWIILGIIAFLFVMASSFYVIWVSKLKDSKKGKKQDKGAQPKKAEASPTAPETVQPKA